MRMSFGLLLSSVSIRALINNSLGVVDELVEVTQPGVTTGQNASANWTTVPANTPRLSYQTTTPNLVPNGSLVGGSSTTLPMGWQVFVDYAYYGVGDLAWSVVGEGQDPSRDSRYVDLRFKGTADGNNTGYHTVRLSPFKSIPADPGQSFIRSMYVKKIAGTIPTSGFGFVDVAVDSDGNLNGFGTSGFGDASLPLNTEVRMSGSTSLSNSSTRFYDVRFGLYVGSTTQSIDFTVRISGIQVEVMKTGVFSASAFSPTTGGIKPVIATTPSALLVEDSSTNLLTQSRDLASSSWTTQSNWIGASSTEVAAPDNVGAVKKMTSDALGSTGQSGFIRHGSLSLSGTHVMTAYMYVPTQTGVTYWQLKASGDPAYHVYSPIMGVFDRWIRVQALVNFTTTAGTLTPWITFNDAFPATGKYFYISNIQLEKGSIFSSYIPTTTSSASRTTDVAKVNWGKGGLKDGDVLVNSTDLNNVGMISGEIVSGGYQTLSSGQYSKINRLTIAPSWGALNGNRSIQNYRRAPATSLNSSGIVASSSSFNRRYAYSGGAVIGDIYEPFGVNLLLWTGDLSNAVWTTTGPVSKVGTNLASVISGASSMELSFGGSSASRLNQAAEVDPLGGPYVFSVWVRAVSGFTSIRLSKDWGSSSITGSDVALTTIWTRVQISANITTPSTSKVTVAISSNTAGDTTNIYAQGAQLERGLTATSYMPSTSTPGTRLSDNTRLDFTSIKENKIYSYSVAYDDGSTSVIGLIKDKGITQDDSVEIRPVMFSRPIVQTIKMIGSRPTSDPDATNYINAMNSPPSAALAAAIVDFFTELKQNGVWYRADQIYLHNLHTRQASRLNLVNPAVLIGQKDVRTPDWTAYKGFKLTDTANGLTISNYYTATSRCNASSWSFGTYIADFTRDTASSSASNILSTSSPALSMAIGKSNGSVSWTSPEGSVGSSTSQNELYVMSRSPLDGKVSWSYSYSDLFYFTSSSNAAIAPGFQGLTIGSSDATLSPTISMSFVASYCDANDLQMLNNAMRRFTAVVSKLS